MLSLFKLRVNVITCRKCLDFVTQCPSKTKLGATDIKKTVLDVEFIKTRADFSGFIILVLRNWFPGVPRRCVNRKQKRPGLVASSAGDFESGI